MKIEVTADRIARSTRGNCEQCPIALAVLETAPNARQVQVTCFAPLSIEIRLWLNGEATGTKFWLRGRDLFDRIAVYDLYGYLEPFSFELPISGQERTFNETR